MRIPIHVSNHSAFVWDADHAATLRSEHRICGVLSGTLPHLSQQNVFLGLPLVLMPEELVLLVEKQLATIVHDPAAHRTPTPAQLQTWDASRLQDITHQVERLAQRRGDGGRETPAMMTAAASSTSMTGAPTQDVAAAAAAIQQKRSEREARRRQLAAEAAAAAAAASEAADADASAAGTIGEGGGGGGERDAPVMPAREPAPSTVGSAVYTISVPTTSDAFSWYEYGHGHGDEDGEVHPDVARHTYDTLGAARDAGVWSYPASAEERARCEVFRDLWEKGYYMGGGGKFGGDWLIYPGDPLRYHSHFVATVQTSPSAPLRPMEVVAHGRLGTATKKAHVLCGWDPDSREVTYMSIEWAGFG
ncbi:hypothetical protein BC827DRAFT_1169438 [Russula dissimulans]|nr:hypothetical protein BC827DRAFT_1169438 [Russula dissimulans]